MLRGYFEQLLVDRHNSVKVLLPTCPFDMEHALPPLFTAFTNFSQWPMNAVQTIHASCTSPVISKSPSSPSYLDSNESRLQNVLAKKRSELSNELSELKVSFKEFSKSFRAKQKEDWRSAYLYCVESFEKYPAKFHWKICLELADLCKRRSLLDAARLWFKMVNELQPFAAAGWVEHAKFEEESGNIDSCRKIIQTGLIFVPYHETLMVKLLKLEEKVDDLDTARALLGTLKGVSNDKVAKTLFEGALMESRAGNIAVSRNVLHYLMHHMKWYGPVYYAAFSIEEKHGFFNYARLIIERGLLEIPRYGPLWFGAFRLYEKMKVDDETLREAINTAVRVISKELIWKVYFEAAQIEERKGLFDKARLDFVQSVRHCPRNLKWKVWLGGARMELRAARIYEARLLLNRAMEEVPQKTRAMVLLECARLEEFAGNLDRSREILSRARHETCYEWKVFLESVLLEIRCRDITSAIRKAQAALEVHSGTGRLWAVLIQLKQHEGQEEQLQIFKQAYQEVPKSGEVWCEGARIHLDPSSPFFCLSTARRYLEFAIKFTPQYGDSFVELLRLEILEKGVDYVAEDLMKKCVNADPNYGAMWFRCKESVLDTALEVLIRAQSIVLEEIYQHRALYQRAILGDWTMNKHNLCMAKLRWQTKNMNSLDLLYPCSKSLSLEQRHRLLFGSSASFHD